MIIVPSMLVDTILQTSGGTTIQRSYGGLQMHRKAYQRRVKSVAQQNQRSNFHHVQSSWNELTPEEHDTWNAAAEEGQSGFELYSSTNNKLTAAGQTIINSYVTPVEPFNPEMTFEGATYEVNSGFNTVTAVWSSSFSEEELGDWRMYQKWTGWIAGSAFRYPDPTLTIPLAAATLQIEFDDSVLMNIVWGSPNQAAPGPVNLQQKTKVTLGWINVVTGQISTGETFEILPS